MESANDKAIKKSSEDTSDFGPMRVNIPRLKRGEEYDRCVVACKTNAVVPPGYIAAIVCDYINSGTAMAGIGNLVNFYYENDTDPRTTIVSFRVDTEGNVRSTSEPTIRTATGELVAFIKGEK